MSTLANLIDDYLSDKQSPFAELEYATAAAYSRELARLRAEYGHVRIRRIKARTLKEWHGKWAQTGVALGHTMITRLRVLMSYGGTLWDNDKGLIECQRIRNSLRDMRFPQGPRRSAYITFEQAKAIVMAALAKDMPSVALAQAFQFESLLRQKDVIGAWVPISERAPSDLVHGAWKWIKGIRWEEVDADMVLSHITSKKKKLVTVDLTTLPLVMLCLQSTDRSSHPATGPIIVCEKTSLPWIDRHYRYAWRQIARECGVPDDVQNRDSRAGGITEALAAGANPDDTRKAATHSQLATTLGYSRAEYEAAGRTMAKRIEARAQLG